MPDDGDKTEQPTTRRRHEARQQGQVARSQDLTTAVLTLVGLLTLDLFGRRLLAGLYNMMQSLLGGVQPILHGNELVPLAKHTAGEMVALMLPILVFLALAGLLTVLLQTGLLFTTAMLKPDLNKMNPVTGLKKMISMHTAVTLLINVVKLSVVAGVVYLTVVGELDRILYASGLPFVELIDLGIDIFFTLGLRVAAVLLLLGIVDFFYQRFRHERGLRMTKQEVKDEMRNMEGDPVMKRRRREVQIQLALQRLQYDVPRADVVVSNPTHFAVALKYDSATMDAPRVLAKGQDYLARRILELAHAAGVPVVEKKPLARALYKLVEVGQEVPPQLYKAVAEVLAYVYALSDQRAVARPAQPQVAV